MGSAVNDIDASAFFESSDSLFNNPYIENGLSFTRNNISLNNNSCGFAGCSTAWDIFTGNYFYGSGTGSYPQYIEISTVGSELFYGLEFMFDSGHGDTFDYAWDALLIGSSVSNGTGSTADEFIAGFSSMTGFDTLRITASYDPFASVYDSTLRKSPAIDNVYAQFSPTSVPEPSILALMGAGLAGLGFARRKRKA